MEKKTNKEKIQYLMQYRFILTEIEQINSSYKYLANKIISPSVQAMTDMPQAGGYSKDKIINNINKLEQLEEFLKKRTDILMDVRIDIELKIMSIKDALTRSIFQLRYIEGRSWNNIYTKIASSERCIHNRHSKALTEMEIE